MTLLLHKHLQAEGPAYWSWSSSKPKRVIIYTTLVNTLVNLNIPE